MRALRVILVIAFVSTLVFLGYQRWRQPHIVRHCDLYVSEGDLCFDRTDGTGKHIAFSDADRKIVDKILAPQPCTPPAAAPQAWTPTQNIAEVQP